MGEILDLTPICEKCAAENDPFLEDYVVSEDIIKMESCEGVLAGLPWNQDPRSFWYNKEAFDAAGVTEMPKTWDDFLAVCEAIKANTDYIPLVIAGNTGVVLDSWHWNLAGQVFDDFDKLAAPGMVVAAHIADMPAEDAH